MSWVNGMGADSQSRRPGHGTNRHFAWHGGVTPGCPGHRYTGLCARWRPLRTAALPLVTMTRRRLQRGARPMARAWTGTRARTRSRRNSRVCGTRASRRSRIVSYHDELMACRACVHCLVGLVHVTCMHAHKRTGRDDHSDRSGAYSLVSSLHGRRATIVPIVRQSISHL